MSETDNARRAARGRDHAMHGVLLTYAPLVYEVRRLAAAQNIKPKHLLAQLVAVALAHVAPKKETP